MKLQPEISRPLSALLPVVLFGLMLILNGSPLFAAPLPKRSLKICVAPDAPPEIQSAAQAVLKAVGTQPLLQVMAKDGVPQSLSDSTALAVAKPEERAYSHIIAIGLPGDPLIRMAWQREAKVEAGGFYIFGWGHLTGDVGYIESDRNPFLHGSAIGIAPFETEIVTITGATPRGVELATEAFLKTGLVNGMVAAPGWKRPQTSLLDRDPVQTAPPEWIPTTAGTMKRIAVTAGGEDEYRGVLEDAGVEPQEIWRTKYFAEGGWDGAGMKMAFENYEAGLHRRASGNTLWTARFASTQEADVALRAISREAKFQPKGSVWYGAQPGYFKGSLGEIALWKHGEWLLMSTLPKGETDALIGAMHE